MSYVQPDLIAWWYKGLYYRDLQMAQCVERGFLTQEQHDDIKAVNGWWGGYRYITQDPQRPRPDSVPPNPMDFLTFSAQSAEADQDTGTVGAESEEESTTVGDTAFEDTDGADEYVTAEVVDDDA